MHRLWAALMGAMALLTFISFALAEPWYTIAIRAGVTIFAAAMTRRCLERSRS